MGDTHTQDLAAPSIPTTLIASSITDFLLKSRKKRRTSGAAQQRHENWDGVLEFSNVHGKIEATRAYAKYPLKFLIPRKASKSDSNCAWVYMLSYGGGLLANDTISISLELKADTTVALTTQSSTKVFKGPAGSAQALVARVGPGAALACVPGPVAPFRDAAYRQAQEFWLHDETSNLIVVDWFTSGRMERGEIWDFSLYQSKTAIYIGGKLLAFDPVQIEPHKQKHQLLMGSLMNVFATVFVIGSAFQPILDQFAEEQSRKSFSAEVKRCAQRKDDFMNGTGGSRNFEHDGNIVSCFSRLEGAPSPAGVYRLADQ
uniref:Urease accessory protein UreD n=1 Tax=Heterosigma akashiwo TaxID=2829 RepID=A0A7S4DER5_HETAK